jgi:hypothetical protein
MVIQKFVRPGDASANRSGKSPDDVAAECQEAAYSPFGRRKLDYSLYERQVRARIMTALNRSRQLAAQLIFHE